VVDGRSFYFVNPGLVVGDRRQAREVVEQGELVVCLEGHGSGGLAEGMGASH